MNLLSNYIICLVWSFNLYSIQLSIKSLLQWVQLKMQLLHTDSGPTTYDERYSKLSDSLLVDKVFCPVLGLRFSTCNQWNVSKCQILVMMDDGYSHFLSCHVVVLRFMKSSLAHTKSSFQDISLLGLFSLGTFGYPLTSKIHSFNLEDEWHRI